MNKEEIEKLFEKEELSKRELKALRFIKFLVSENIGFSYKEDFIWEDVASVVKLKCIDLNSDKDEERDLHFCFRDEGLITERLVGELEE